MPGQHRADNPAEDRIQRLRGLAPALELMLGLVRAAVQIDDPQLALDVAKTAQRLSDLAFQAATGAAVSVVDKPQEKPFDPTAAGPVIFSGLNVAERQLDNEMALTEDLSTHRLLRERCRSRLTPEELKAVERMSRRLLSRVNSARNAAGVAA